MGVWKGPPLLPRPHATAIPSFQGEMRPLRSISVLQADEGQPSTTPRRRRSCARVSISPARRKDRPSPAARRTEWRHAAPPNLCAHRQRARCINPSRSDVAARPEGEHPAHHPRRHAEEPRRHPPSSVPPAPRGASCFSWNSVPELPAPPPQDAGPLPDRTGTRPPGPTERPPTPSPATVRAPTQASPR